MKIPTNDEFFAGGDMVKQNREKERTVARDTVLMVALACLAIGFVGGTVFGVYKSGEIGPLPAGTANSAQKREMERALLAETEKNPNNATSWIQLGNVYFDSGRPKEAIAAYEKAIVLKPDDADTITDLGVMYRRSGEPEKAVECFDRAVAVNPKHEIARFNKGIVLLHDLNEKQRALQVWEKLLEINPVAMAPNGQTLEELIRHFRDHDHQ